MRIFLLLTKIKIILHHQWK